MAKGNRLGWMDGWIRWGSRWQANKNKYNEVV